METQLREEWLRKLTGRLNGLLFNNKLPEYRVTCSWPSHGATSRKGRVIGQCFDPICSDDNTTEIIITMGIAEPMEVAEVLAHEMVHAIVGCKCGHKGEFKKLALAIGLEGKMTATSGSAAFKQAVQKVLNEIGNYPHAVLNVSEQIKKQGTRLLKCICEGEGEHYCGYTVRITRTWINNVGLPYCPFHGEMIEVIG